MALFNEDEIDISGEEDVDTSEQQNALPDEIEADEPEQQEEESVEDNTDIEEPEEAPEEPQPEEQSSLTPEPEAQPEEEPEAPAPSEDQIFATLSEKLGREVNSWEDLTPEPEDPFDGDQELQAIAEWKKKTGRPLSDWANYQKDYNSLSNEDVVREYLQHQYPEFTPEEISLEMEDYVANEDLDTDSDVARKNLRLKKAAITARQELDKFRTSFDTPVEPKLSKEHKEAIDFYKQYQEQEAKQKQSLQSYSDGITSEVKNVKSVPLQLADDLSIDLSIDPKEATDLTKQITEAPHWFNKDGSYNYQAIVNDAVKIKNFDKAVKLAYEQGVAKGLETDDAESRNVNLGARPTNNQNSNEDEIVIEGADSFESSLKFRKR